MFKSGDLVKLVWSQDREYMGLSLCQEAPINNAAPWLVDLRGKHKRYYIEDGPLLFLNKEEKNLGIETVTLYHFLWGKEKWYYLEAGYDNIPIEKIFEKVSQ